MVDESSQPENPETAEHWDTAYQAKTFDLHSWYQSEPVQSLAMITAAKAQPADPLIDVGGGTSLLVDQLLAQGFLKLAVLDISGAALATSRQRLGARDVDIDWICADIRNWDPPRRYAVWHDRALFHFLTRDDERQCYLAALKKGLQQGGQLILAAFAIGGPRRCSGLDIVQYDAEKLLETLGGGFELLEQTIEDHATPAGGLQRFAWFRLKRT